jgi:stage II sporulation protein AA (anti-sigma F factor antagonist)
MMAVIGPLDPGFALRREDEGGVAVVVVEGEVDFASSVALRETLAALEGRVVVDLCEATFMDSSGLQVLLTASADPKRCLHLACPPTGPVQRLFAVAGVGEWLKVHESRSAALAAFRPRA